MIKESLEEKSYVICYAIRHVRTRQLMPTMKRGRGYTHWNPNTENGRAVYAATEFPRLFATEQSAKKTISQWAQGRLVRSFTTNFYGETDDILDVKKDGRGKEDLEVVEIYMRINNGT